MGNVACEAPWIRALGNAIKPGHSLDRHTVPTGYLRNTLEKDGAKMTSTTTLSIQPFTGLAIPKASFFVIYLAGCR